MKRRILWIEDSAFGENVSLSAPVALSGRYDLKTAVSATAGLTELSRTEFDAVIVDIRIVPGNDPRWIREYNDRGSSAKAARLGLRLLEVILGNAGELWKDATLSEPMRKPSRYGVLTVEARQSLNPDLDRLGVNAYRNKHAAASKRLLLELIDEVIQNDGRR